MNPAHGSWRKLPALLRREWKLVLAVLAIVLAFFLPNFPATRNAHRILVTFDLSQSMGVMDVALDGNSVSRLDLAKAAAERLLADLPCGSEVGWAGFVERRTTTLVAPLEVCEHFNALTTSLDQLDGRMRWGQASSIGKGLHQLLRAGSALGEDTSVVLISDGQEAPPLRVGQSGLPKDEGLGIQGALIGVGGDTPVPIPRFDINGQQIGYWSASDVVQRADATAGQQREELSMLDSRHLSSLASLSGLAYAPLSRPTDLLEALDGADLGKPTRVPTDWRWVPIGLALCLLCWRLLISARSGR